MNPTLATYLGFVVAFVIILWSLVELNRRYFRRRRASKRMMHTWMPLNPSSANSAEEQVVKTDAAEQGSMSDLQTRAQQNGHYSQPRHLWCGRASLFVLILHMCQRFPTLFS